MSQGFSTKQIKEWNKDRGQCFAIALARITNWMIQVACFAKSEEDRNKTPLRFHVSDKNNRIYDFTGSYNIHKFYTDILQPIITQEQLQGIGCAFNAYSEQSLFKRSLQPRPTESQIKQMIEAIELNEDYLNAIPERKKPIVPTEYTVRFSHGKCNSFAEAMYDVKAIQPIAIVAKKFKENSSLTTLGYVHSCNIIDEDNVIDIWGIDTLQNVIDRYHIAEFELCQKTHLLEREKLKQISLMEFEENYNLSKKIIDDYF